MKRILLLCCAVMTVAALQAQTIIHVPGDYSKIQDAIVAAGPGDTVLVADGIYYEQINFLGKTSLTVASEFLIDGDLSHISQTVIDGSQLPNPDSATVVYFTPGSDTTTILCGFTIRGGKGSVFYPSGLIIRDGGGIFLDRSGAKIIHNHITENHLSDSIGPSPIYVIGAGVSTSGEECNEMIIFEYNVVDHNSVYGSCNQVGSAGGEIWYNARVTNNTFSDNTATGLGNCSVVGGGFIGIGNIAWAVLSEIIFKDNIVSNNLVQSTINYTAAGGVLFQTVKCQVENNIFAGNSALSGQGNSEGGAGLLIFDPQGSTIIRNNTFQGNISNTWGGGLFTESYTGLTDPKTVVVENNYFYDNEAGYGGAFGNKGCHIIFQNNVLRGNHATKRGGGINLDATTAINLEHPVTISNCSFSENTADVSGGAVYSGVRNLIVMNSIFWKDTSNSLTGQEIYAINLNDTIEAANNDFDPTLVRGVIVDGGGNINEDPLFDNLTTLIPTNWSPCVETGAEAYTCLCGDTHYAPAYDIRGFVRPTGAGYDMGAYDLEGWAFGVEPINNSGLIINNKPNPFTNTTTLTYFLNEPGTVTLRIVNGYGQTVETLVNEYQQKGEQSVTWNAEGQPAGVYFYRIEVGGKTAGGKMVKK